MTSNRALLRFLGALVLLSLAITAAVVFLAAVGMLRVDQLTAGAWWAAPLALLPQLPELGTASPQVRLAAAGGAFAIGLLALGVLARSLRGRSDAPAVHMLSADDRGFVVIDSRGIATIAEQAAARAHGVVDAAVRVTGAGARPVRLRVEVCVYPGADVKRAGTETRAAVAEAVQRLVGLDVRDVVVAVHVVEPEELAGLLVS